MVAGLIIASWIAATINNFALVSKITVWIYLIAMFVEDTNELDVCPYCWSDELQEVA